MGKYTEALEFFASELGFEPIVPPKTTQETIKLGVRHSSDMVCFPFKSTLGNLIQGLERGAEVIIATGVNPSDKLRETCRFAFYYHIQEQILRRMGYDFEMAYMNVYLNGGGRKILNILKKTNPKLTYFDIAKAVKRSFDKVKEIEEREYKFEKKEINVGLVGEVYTLWEEAINYNIIDKLRKMGVGVHLSVKLSWFLKEQIGRADKKKELHEEVKKYFPKKTGGHGFETLCNSIWYAKNNFDGIIHLLPLSCMPETLVEMPLNFISEDYKIPVYRFSIDENRFEAGFDTRLETFIKLLKRNKNGLLAGN